MTRYIDAEKLLKHIPYEEIVSRFAVVNSPTEDVEPVKHGMWVDKGHFTTMCSCCEHYVSRGLLFDYETMNFCPNCGAKMDEKE